MTTQYYTASTLDGFIADEHTRSTGCSSSGRSRGRRGYRLLDFMREVGAVAMGSTTYQWLLEHEIRPKDGRRSPGRTRSRRGCSPRASCRGWRAPTSASCAATCAPCTRQMEAAAGAQNVWLVGGGDLVGQFHDHGLLDEIIVSIAR